MLVPFHGLSKCNQILGQAKNNDNAVRWNHPTVHKMAVRKQFLTARTSLVPSGVSSRRFWSQGSKYKQFSFNIEALRSY